MVRYASSGSLHIITGRDVESSFERFSSSAVTDLSKETLYFICEGLHAGAPANDNGDLFPLEELLKKSVFGCLAFETWKDRPLLENHDETKRRGIIPDVYFEHGRNSVDMLCALDRTNYPKIATSIENGTITDTSMGTVVDYGICSVCGNKAYNENQWCPHLKYEKGRREASTGQMIHEINFGLQGLENSLITYGRGADPLAKIRQILAQKSSMSAAEVDLLINEEYNSFCSSLGVHPSEFAGYLKAKYKLN